MNKKVRRGLRHIYTMARIGPCPVCQGSSCRADGSWCSDCGVTGRRDEYVKRLGIKDDSKDTDTHQGSDSRS